MFRTKSTRPQSSLGDPWYIKLSGGMAEREGFEPPIGLHLCRISSAVHSTTLPPLQVPRRTVLYVLWSGEVLGEVGGPDKARAARKLDRNNRFADKSVSRTRRRAKRCGASRDAMAAIIKLPRRRSPPGQRPAGLPAAGCGRCRRRWFGARICRRTSADTLQGADAVRHSHHLRA